MEKFYEVLRNTLNITFLYNFFYKNTLKMTYHLIYLFGSAACNYYDNIFFRHNHSGTYLKIKQ